MTALGLPEPTPTGAPLVPAKPTIDEQVILLTALTDALRGVEEDGHPWLARHAHALDQFTAATLGDPDGVEARLRAKVLRHSAVAGFQWRLVWSQDPTFAPEIAFGLPFERFPLRDTTVTETELHVAYVCFYVGATGVLPAAL